MSKLNIYLFLHIIFSLLFIIHTEDLKKEEEENEQDEYFDEDSDEYFKKSLKEYLVERNLFDSDKIIQPEEMKKIFLEVVTEGDAESSSEYFGGIFIELADHFVNEYYKQKQEIRGKDIYELIDMNPISQKFEELMTNNSKYNGEDANDNEYYNPDYDHDYDYDYRDDIGDPILDA